MRRYRVRHFLAVFGAAMVVMSALIVLVAAVWPAATMAALAGVILIFAAALATPEG
jgi:hypothetical protein